MIDVLQGNNAAIRRQGDVGEVKGQLGFLSLTLHLLQQNVLS